MTDKRPFLILKIGGSLFSDKAAHRHVDIRSIERYSRLVAELALAAPGRVALVVGGGSFGHGAVREASPEDPLGILQLTEANFALKWIWVGALRAAGARAVPLQLTAMCLCENADVSVYTNVVGRALAVSFLPVLSGDCLIDAHGTLQLCGSDRVPQVLLQCVQPPVRVVVLTDTPGILVRRGSTAVLPSVDPNEPSAAFRAAWSGRRNDTTAGMVGKLEALVEIARLGAECFIMKGHPDARSLAHLLEPVETWPADEPWTRIARP